MKVNIFHYPVIGIFTSLQSHVTTPPMVNSSDFKSTLSRAFVIRFEWGI